MSTSQTTSSPAVDQEEQVESGSRILGLKIPWFLLLLAITVTAAMTGAMPNEIISGFTVTILLGGLIYWAGDRVPVLRDYGLPTVLCILLPATLLFLGWFPQSLAEVITTFTDEVGFLDFYVASLIAGSILGMPRQLLIKAGMRYAVPLTGMVLLVFLLIGGLAALMGFGFRDGILFVAGPILGGGIGAGAVPMSEMYAAQLGGSSSDFLAQIVPAIVVANTLAIFAAGIYNGISRNGRQLFVGFNGQGNLVRATGTAEELGLRPRSQAGPFKTLATGLVIAGALFLAGNIIATYVPGLHAYAWTILLASLIKIFGLLPAFLEDAVSSWYSFVAETLTAALLVGVSISFLDLSQLLSLLTSPAYLTLTLATVLLAAVISGLIGYWVKMYFVESSIAIGLGMTDMGGTGDVAVLSAANRLELMPFLQLSSRLGGAFVLLLLSVLIPLLDRI
ncbi:Na+/citrate or Na+/malate symporter [Micrococcus luteus]|uniref:Na+/citrate or Na+/malate symporter n=1 Tax=Micrococcus luteus TaxID=1270 RepID=A0ABD7MAQ0_MICLU|nr:2-hydroxycarboxylate transporter family protein [Micrococcus luteus]MCV7563638.1 2-hydroxycarboxylate transporter family protein [Micrococcus luteus]MCV7636613.1 2-hydroxycarboxylate transporter family protein [Micrococcus luteus]MCV7683533.1 2-hydroxycarboxylate transporter family protein [Micrococcus luteus]MDK7177923.1 2-hydroxycarboxylate transporter family protein [Micrococcus luteus]SHL88431.1 Na+/citrate or Na+/malate symporter [Micrococcus luteus]